MQNLTEILAQLPFLETIKTTQSEFDYTDKYPHIEVTAEELFTELQKLKHRKEHALKMQKLNQSFQNWTAQEYYSRAIERMQSFMLSKGVSNQYLVEQGSNYEILVFLCYYFAGSQNELMNHVHQTQVGFTHIAAEKVSIHKGILLMGNTGRGKSMLMKAFSQNPRRSYQFVESKYIRDEYKNKEGNNKSGIEVIRHFSADFESTGRSMFNQNSFDLCIDDLGDEEAAMMYGEKIEVAGEVIMNRLNSNRVTHLTTNLDLKEIKDRYGSRLFSRLHEQMNILYFPKETPDFRKL